MHKGSVVTIDSGVIHLKRSLLSPLSIDDDSTLFGLYYPSKHSKLKKIEYGIEPDFMFTSVPPRMWYSVAKLVFFVKHEPGTIFNVLEYLKKFMVNILIVDCSRAGHRYMVITAIVEFEELSDKNNLDIISNNLSKNEILGKQLVLRNMIDGVLNNIKKYKKKYIFEETYGNEKFGGVHGYIINSLQYFYDVVGENSYSSEIFQPFEVKVVRSNVVFDDTDWKNKFSNIFENLLPTYGFASASTQDLNLRVQIFPKKELNNFKKCMIHYKMDNTKLENKKTTTRGLTADIANVFFMYKMNIWSFESTLYNNNITEEEGTITIMAQSVDKNVRTSSLKRHVGSFLKKEEQNNPGLKFESIMVMNMFRFPIFVSMRSKAQKEHYKELFFEAGLKYGLIKEDFIFFENENRDITGSVIKSMKSCEAMVQVHSISDENEVHTSVWLEAEGLLARSMEMPFSIICHKRLEGELKLNKDHDYIWMTIDLEVEHITKALEKVIKLKLGNLNRL